MNALEPYISAQNVELHYDVLQRRYFDRVNELIAGTRFEQATDLLQIVVACEDDDAAIFLQASQAWNHWFFWHSMRPNHTGVPSAPAGPLAALVRRDHGSLAALREQFVAAAKSIFGSGWVWLAICDEGQLVIKTTPNTGNPIRNDKKPIIVCDVWEHAYYPDYGPDRDHFVATWFDMLASWPYAQANANDALRDLAP